MQNIQIYSTKHSVTYVFISSSLLLSESFAPYEKKQNVCSSSCPSGKRADLLDYETLFKLLNKSLSVKTEGFDRF